MSKVQLPRIHLVTGPVQTGKTTRLRAWCEHRTDVDGILAPVVDGRRHLLHIRSGVLRNLEEVSGGATTVTVRRFTFNANVFAWARGCQVAATTENHAQAGGQRWIIVDEVGPLELSGSGLEPAVGELLVRVMEDAPRIRQEPTGVVLVIREHLVDDALKHFGVSPAAVDRFPFA